MPETRAKKHHQDRVAETLREEISTMIGGELADPRISFAYVTEVVLAPGGKSARIYISVDGEAKEEDQTLAGLQAARGYIRYEVRERMGKRHVPELTFHLDRSAHLKERIDELLGRKRGRRRVEESETHPQKPEPAAADAAVAAASGSPALTASPTAAEAVKPEP